MIGQRREDVALIVYSAVLGAAVVLAAVLVLAGVR
jgi:hypothetical protein